MSAKLKAGFYDRPQDIEKTLRTFGDEGMVARFNAVRGTMRPDDLGLMLPDLLTQYAQRRPREAKKAVQKTAGACCMCGRPLFRNPDQAERLDDAARYCPKCGTDICVHCLQKLGGGQAICPVCGETVVFEINPMFRP